jgi:peptide/nickel transport system substrate-binding protein
LQRAFPVEGTIILERNPDFPDPANKWERFAAPAIAVSEVDGPGRITIGDEAVFDIFIDDQSTEAAYTVDDIQEVKYLVFDATGELVSSGAAEAAEDGLWQVTLGSDLTSGLEAGSNRLEVVVVSKLVALPSLASFEFVTAP